MLAGLVLAGLATVTAETMRAGAATMKVERYKITDDGRDALATGAQGATLYSHKGRVRL